MSLNRLTQELTERLTQDYWNKLENRSAIDYYSALTLEDITIANPYILDEQYTGATTTPAPEIAGTGAAAKPVPLPSMVFTLATLLIVSRWRRG